MTLGRGPQRGQMTYEAVARALGVSRTRVVQIERSAISKLAAALDLPLPFTIEINKAGKPRRLLKRSA